MPVKAGKHPCFAGNQQVCVSVASLRNTTTHAGSDARCQSGSRADPALLWAPSAKNHWASVDRSSASGRRPSYRQPSHHTWSRSLQDEEMSFHQATTHRLTFRYGKTAARAGMLTHWRMMLTCANTLNMILSTCRTPVRLVSFFFLTSLTPQLRVNQACNENVLVKTLFWLQGISFKQHTERRPFSRLRLHGKSENYINTQRPRIERFHWLLSFK